jgi:hypothetical protein
MAKSPKNRAKQAFFTRQNTGQKRPIFYRVFYLILSGYKKLIT